MDKDINRDKVILLEKNLTNKSFEKQFGKYFDSILKLCCSTIQSTLDAFLRITELLDVQIQEVVRMPQCNG